MAHIPQRMCIVCRNMYDKPELIKMVREENTVVIDKCQDKFGRGAYICKNRECIEKAAKRKILSQKFKMPVGDDIYACLRGAIDG